MEIRRWASGKDVEGQVDWHKRCHSDGSVDASRRWEQVQLVAARVKPSSRFIISDTRSGFSDLKWQVEESSMIGISIFGSFWNLELECVEMLMEKMEREMGIYIG